MKNKLFAVLSLVLSVAIVSGFLLTSSVFASRVNSVANLNGLSTVTVLGGTTVTANLSVVLTSGTNWRSTGYTIGADAMVCVDTVDRTSNGTYSESFPMVAGMTDGVFDVTFYTYGQTACGGATPTITTLASALVVDSTAPVTTVTSHTNGNYVAGNNVVISADSTDALSSVAKVEFWNSNSGSEKIGEIASAPYSISWDTTSLADGAYDIWAVGFDTVGNNVASTHVSVNVDNANPVLSLPVTIITEATGPSGAVVSYSATATDANPASPSVNCAPVSGSIFVLGTTTVSCSVTDSVGNTANGSFDVVVRDTTKPVITLNGSSPVEIQVIVGSYTELGASVSDIYDTGLTIATVGGATVDTGTVGTYVVTYNATDSNGNVADQVTRTVNVVDQEDPITTDSILATWQNADVVVTLTCTDNVACTKVYYTTDGTDPTTASSFVDLASNWQFTVSAEGDYTVKYFGEDTSLNAESIKTASNHVRLDKNVQTSVVTAPIAGTSTRASFTFSANATDSLSGISKVEFWNGTSNVKVGEVSVAPYSFTWDTLATSTLTADGDYNIYAKAFDNAGNYLQSANVAITIDNTVPVITLTGLNPFRVRKYTAYHEPGVIITDNLDSAIASRLVTTSNLNINVAQLYTVRYNVTDLAGNVATEVTRDVRVFAVPRLATTTEEITGTSTSEVLSATSTESGISQESGPVSNQVIVVEPEVTTSPIPSEQVLGAEKFVFMNNLGIGSNISPDVKELQKRLISEGFLANGYATGVYGLLTKNAVLKYQEAHRDEILAPLGLTVGTGFVGPYTRKFLNK